MDWSRVREHEGDGNDPVKAAGVENGFETDRGILSNVMKAKRF
jgi:hypothetical protein